MFQLLSMHFLHPLIFPLITCSFIITSSPSLKLTPATTLDSKTNSPGLPLSVLSNLNQFRGHGQCCHAISISFCPLCSKSRCCAPSNVAVDIVGILRKEHSEIQEPHPQLLKKGRHSGFATLSFGGVPSEKAYIL